MQVMQFDEYGPPDVMYLAEAPAPSPGAGQLQIQVAAIGVNPADYKWRAGYLHAMAPLRFPHVVGYDVAGVVTAVGSGVHRIKPGDRIVATVASGYAEVAVADEGACALLPGEMDFVQAAALPCPALTGEQMVAEGIGPEPGETVLVIGATGGVGRFAVAAALAAKARVVAAVRPAYFDEALRLGADEAIAVDGEVTAGRRFDHVADTVGGDLAARLCRSVAPAGRVMTVATDPIAPDAIPVPVQFFSYHADGERLADIVRRVADKSITMPIARCMPLAAAPEAHRLLEAGGLSGRIVLEPEGFDRRR